eukprot:UN15937
MILNIIVQSKKKILHIHCAIEGILECLLGSHIRNTNMMIYLGVKQKHI